MGEVQGKKWKCRRVLRVGGQSGGKWGEIGMGGEEVRGRHMKRGWESGEMKESERRRGEGGKRSRRRGGGWVKSM